MLKPPRFEANPIIKRRYRFLATAGTSTTVTPATLLQAAGCCADTAVLAQSVWSAVKINRITMWSSPTGGNASSVSVTFNGNAATFVGGNSKEFRDDSNNVSVPAYLSVGPPRNTTSAFWQTTTATLSLFQIQATVGTIVDVHLSLVMIDGANNPPAAALVTVGNTPGLIFYYPLDGRGGIFTPLGLTIGG